MDNELILHEEFYISWMDDEGHFHSRGYSRPKDAKKELAQLQALGNKEPIYVSIQQTRLLNLLEVKPADTTDYSTVFDRPLDN